jgi:membrane-associated phospholipid phosphatase
VTRFLRWSAVVAVAVVVGTLIAVLGHAQWLTTFDTSVLEPLHRYGLAHPGWVRAWDVLCTVFHPAVFRVIAWVWIVVALVRRQVRVALFLTLSVEVSGLLVVLLKALVDRPRPATALVFESSTSYPSGHALGVMAGVLGLAIVARPLVRPRHRRTLLVVGVLIVIAIGVGRVVLNVHNPSDVLAGWALGYLWVLACLPVLGRRPLNEGAGTPAAPGTAP